MFDVNIKEFNIFWQFNFLLNLPKIFRHKIQNGAHHNNPILPISKNLLNPIIYLLIKQANYGKVDNLQITYLQFINFLLIDKDEIFLDLFDEEDLSDLDF